MPAPETKRSSRLTLKMPPNRVREVTHSENEIEETLASARPSRSKAKAPIVEDSSEAVSDDEEESGDSENSLDEESSGQEDEAEDEEMSEELPPPTIRSTINAAGKPSFVVTPAIVAKVRSVESKEMDMDGSDDDELSDLHESELESEQGEGAGEGVEDLNAEDDDMSEGDVTGSRGASPDLSKLTRRQRAHFANEFEGGLMSLSNGLRRRLSKIASANANTYDRGPKEEAPHR